MAVRTFRGPDKIRPATTQIFERPGSRRTSSSALSQHNATPESRFIARLCKDGATKQAQDCARSREGFQRPGTTQISPRAQICDRFSIGTDAGGRQKLKQIRDKKKHKAVIKEKRKKGLLPEKKEESAEEEDWEDDEEDEDDEDDESGDDLLDIEAEESDEDESEDEEMHGVGLPITLSRENFG